jgi:SAM-dependent methyltransferase
MIGTFKLSPFATFVESQLIPAVTQTAVFHRLTGALIEPDSSLRQFLQALKNGVPLSLDLEHLAQFGESGHQVRKLIELALLIPEHCDPLAPFVDHYVNQPLQNPALSYQNEKGEFSVVSISMAEQLHSPELGKLPTVNEEKFSPLATNILRAADGTKTLRQICAAYQSESAAHQYDREFREAIEFLTKPERQLIKFAPAIEGFANPFYPANLVPRNLYHGSRWTASKTAKSIGDFHVEGIDDAAWEFDIIEPTVNHGLRFPSQLLAGLDYGMRFCDAVLADGFPGKTSIEVLEIGGGTGSFARSFIQRARAQGKSFTYQIMDLSPTLSENQRRLLSDIDPPVGHINQDAVRFDLPGRKFDLIVLNEVIADFPVAAVKRHDGVRFSGEGAALVEKYGLTVDDAPDSFYVTAGVFEFLERAWHHLKPGGRLILSEYGSKSRYPVESFHLNHSEFTIHFGHVIECARKIGFDCRLEMLTDYLGIDDRAPVLCGREEHILCLDYVFKKYGETIPFALFSELDFKTQFGEIAGRSGLGPIRFLPLRSNFHYGPDLGDFFVMILEMKAS